MAYKLRPIAEMTKQEKLEELAALTKLRVELDDRLKELTLDLYADEIAREVTYKEEHGKGHNSHAVRKQG